MKKSLFGALSAVVLAASSGQALAVDVVNCHAFSSAATAYNDCVGLSSGNTGVASANAAFAGDPTYSIEYKDNNTGDGSDNAVFDLVNNGNDSVTLKFLQNVGDGTSTSVIALKFGGQGVNQLGYFRFDLADFDIGEMLTFTWNPSFTGDGISHASVFSNTVTTSSTSSTSSNSSGNVPEPATPLMALAGLAALAVGFKRRKPV